MHRTRKSLHALPAAAALLAAAVGPVHAEDEQPPMGTVDAVRDGGSVVVIGGQAYRTMGRQVQPPRGTDPESSEYQQQPFQPGMIVRYVTGQGGGELPVVRRAWAIK